MPLLVSWMIVPSGSGARRGCLAGLDGFKGGSSEGRFAGLDGFTEPSEGRFAGFADLEGLDAFGGGAGAGAGTLAGALAGATAAVGGGFAAPPRGCGLHHAHFLYVPGNGFLCSSCKVYSLLIASYVPTMAVLVPALSSWIMYPAGITPAICTTNGAAGVAAATVSQIVMCEGKIV